MLIKKEMIVNIITVKAVRNIPICIKSLSVMYTASPPFKVQRTSGDEFDRLSSKVSLKINYIMCVLYLSTYITLLTQPSENVLTLF